MSAWWAEHAWLGGDDVRHGVLLEADGGRLTAVTDAAAPPAGAVVLRGLVLPGLVDGHSHAFHRALRGHVQAERGTFWTWRERMYAVASTLQPESYRALATAVFAEMALAGTTCVGEFHYLHHDADGVPYADPVAMAEAVVQGAALAGVRITLLDTCYLAGGFADDGAGRHRPLQGPQRRFGDGTGAAWAQRAELTRSRLTGPTARVGAAVHSVRAVPSEHLAEVGRWAQAHDAPLHVHLSEQVAENAACVAAYGRTPTEQLDAAGLLGPRTTAVHATHLQAGDVALLGRSGASVCLCPTTERDLADGIGPAGELAAAGVPLTVGSDSHAVGDLLEEARGVEADERLRTRRRGRFRARELLTAATSAGADSLGWPGLGVLAPGAPADLVAVGLGSVRTAGWTASTLLETAVFAATAADVTDVVVGGRTVVAGGVHQLVDDVPGALHAAVRAAAGAAS